MKNNPSKLLTTEKPTDDQADNPTLLVGIDWADETHTYHLITPDGKVCAGALDQDPPKPSLTIFPNGTSRSLAVESKSV